MVVMEGERQSQAQGAGWYTEQAAPPAPHPASPMPQHHQVTSTLLLGSFLKANLFRMVPVVPNQTITLKPPPQRVNTSCSLPMGEYNHMVSTTLLLSSSESEIVSFDGMWLDLNNDRGNSCGMPGNCNLETPHLVHLG